MVRKGLTVYWLDETHNVRPVIVVDFDPRRGEVVVTTTNGVKKLRDIDVFNTEAAANFAAINRAALKSKTTK